MKQKPAFLLNVVTPPGSFDINVSPDKREIILSTEDLILDELRRVLNALYESSRHTFFVNQPPDNSQKLLGFRINSDKLSRNREAFSQSSVVEVDVEDQSNDREAEVRPSQQSQSADDLRTPISQESLSRSITSTTQENRYSSDRSLSVRDSRKRLREDSSKSESETETPHVPTRSRDYTKAAACDSLAETIVTPVDAQNERAASPHGIEDLAGNSCQRRRESGPVWSSGVSRDKTRLGVSGIFKERMSFIQSEKSNSTPRSAPLLEESTGEQFEDNAITVGSHVKSVREYDLDSVTSVRRMRADQPASGAEQPPSRGNAQKGAQEVISLDAESEPEVEKSEPKIIFSALADDSIINEKKRSKLVVNFSLDNIKHGIQFLQNAKAGGSTSFFSQSNATGDAKPVSISPSDVDIDNEKGVKVLSKQVIKTCSKLNLSNCRDRAVFLEFQRNEDFRTIQFRIYNRRASRRFVYIGSACVRRKI
jgi:hypothetical protein